MKIKIAIPTNDGKGLDGTVAEHFGRCNTYTMLDEEGNLLGIIDNTSEHMGGSYLPPEILKRNGTNILLCRGLGSRALNMCSEFHIDVYVCQTETVKEIFDMWKNNKIKKAGSDDVCEH